MRVVKDAEERRNEILDAAEELFNHKGFDGTSTNDILEKVGIARGTLYYHFKCKADIMDALIERYNVNIVDAAKVIAANKCIPIKERIIQVVGALNISNGSGKEIIEHIHKPQNALMHQKIQKVIVEGITPILTEIIEEGIEEKIFSTPFPYECMEMIMIYANTVFDNEESNLSEKEQARRMKAFIFNVERLLGMENGTLMKEMQLFASKNGGADE